MSEDYRSRLADDDVVCLEVYGKPFVAIVWDDPERGIIVNMRFGSGRHKTLIDPSLEKLVNDDRVEDVNVVSEKDKQEVNPDVS